VLAVAAGTLISFVLLACMWGRPLFALISWLASVALLPSWIGLYAPILLPVQSIIGLLVVLAIGGSIGYRFNGYDLYFCSFIVLTLTIVVLADGSRSLWVTFVVQWAVSYLVARTTIPAIGSQKAATAVALTMAVVGGAAVAEFAFHWHPYVNFFASMPGHQIWGSIQTRAGTDRSEWAFGHSIALGGSLALSIPFVVTSSFRPPLKNLLVGLLLSGTLATLSRGAIISAVLTLLLCGLAYLSKRGLRVGMGIVGLVVIAVSALLPGQITRFALGVTSETQQSAEYRNVLYDQLLPQLSALGPSGYLNSGGSDSIDSAFLYVGVFFGWIPLLLFVLPLVIIFIRLLRGSASAIEVGILGQAPLLLTVALITQYQLFLFFAIGFAVQVCTSEGNRRVHDRLLDTTSPNVDNQGQLRR